MKVVYTGGSSLAYRSAPSRTPYVFFPGVPQAVKPEDEQFFRNKSANPANPWQIEGMVEAVTKTTADAVVDVVEKVTGKLAGKGKKKGAYKGDDE